MDRLSLFNPLRRISSLPTPAGPAAASGRTYQIESERATPGCRAWACDHTVDDSPGQGPGFEKRAEYEFQGQPCTRLDVFNDPLFSIG
jgi:hypothetical protein